MLRQYAFGVGGGDLERLGEFVVSDGALLRELASMVEQRRFVEAVVARAAESGLTVDSSEIEEALRSARRRWNERWV
jgi:hypothetical protein